MHLKVIISILIFNLISSEEPNSNLDNRLDMAISYGFLSEKIPVSFFDFSAIMNLSLKSEIYTSFSYVIFGGGLGIGYKYYLGNESESSQFISTSAHYSILGDGYQHFYGISIAPGYCIKHKNNTYTTREVVKEFKKTSMNIGLSFTYMGDHSYGVFPFVSWENRF